MATNGFTSAYSLTLHFNKHGALLGCTTEADYLAMAEAFLGGPRTVGVSECVRQSDAHLLRFDEDQQRFGILVPGNRIKTFYQFNPPPRDARWFAKQCAN